MAATTRRWLFADQLGPHYLDDPDTDRALLVESVAVFRRRRFHRRKAHLVLSALRHRAAELGDRAVVVRADTYREGLARWRSEHGDDRERLTVSVPTSRPALRLVEELTTDGVLEVAPERGWAVTRRQFDAWVARRGDGRLLLEDFYRDVRRLHDLLLDADGEPEGGRWNYDADNREPPPRGVTRLADTVDVDEPWRPAEDDVDEQVRADLDRWQREEGVAFVGDDGPRRFAVTRDEALAALEAFVRGRLAAFGPHEDAMLAKDRWMAHSLLSAPLNLGLLHPLEVAGRAIRAYGDGEAPLASVEGFVRQVVGWREYVRQLYWHLGEEYRDRNALEAHRPLPDWWQDLDAAGTVEARCLSDVLAGVREEGWVHHIPRLMVLGNWALQHGYDPAAVTDWFHRNFVDGYDWVMLPNVVGMSQHADGGLMATKPYASGGACINRMSDYCSGCRYDPRKRTGPDACPFTAGYWAFLHRARPRLAGNHRMGQALRGLDRLSDLDAVLEQEAARGDGAP
jgi:deoxyribodipyrimidine photolyase-related protein